MMYTMPGSTLPLAERHRKQARSDVDDGNHAVVGHARRADHAERADDLAVHFVRRGHHAHFLDGDEVRLAANENLHALRVARHVEQLKETRLLIEYIEQ